MNWEVLNSNLKRGQFRVAIVDFDGTVSLIREGWYGLMAALGLDHLREQQLPVEASMTEYLEEQVLLLSGKPTIFQMHRLGEIITERGGVAPDPQALLEEFLRRLYDAIAIRKARLRSGEDSPDQWSVPGTRPLLQNLQQRGVELYLVSGTDLESVLEEIDLLQLREFFGERIFAPAHGTPKFSKAEVFGQILAKHGIPAAELMSFGDGYAETVEAHRVGALAIGVASREAHLPGIHEMKRRMLMDLGADLIIPDYLDQEALLTWCFAGQSR
jgi:phosphoglycolate phosphatase